MWKGRYFARAGGSLVRLSLDKSDEIRGQTSPHDWTAVVVTEAPLNDLDPAAVARAQQGLIERHAPRIPASGSDHSRYLLSPHLAPLTWGLRGDEEAYEHFHLPFLMTATALPKRIRNVQNRLMPPNELIYREIRKYDERSVLEAIYNCIAHQGYRQHARVIVTEYLDRLEFISGGSFVDGELNQHAVSGRTPGRYRNPALVEAMAQLNSKILNLLTKLRRDGVIRSVGAARSARWVFADVTDQNS